MKMIDCNIGERERRHRLVVRKFTASEVYRVSTRETHFGGGG